MTWPSASPASGERRFPPTSSPWSEATPANPTRTGSTRWPSDDASPTGAFGVSGFYAVTEAGVLDLAGDRLSRFSSLRVYDPGRLVTERLELLPTFQTPHVTIGFADLESGLSALARAVKERRPNPYHSG